MPQSEELLTTDEIKAARRDGKHHPPPSDIKSAARSVALPRHLYWLQRVVGEVNEANGWRSGDVSVTERIALLHTELAEATEAVRNGRPESEKADGFENLEEELGDVLIRVLDLADAEDLDVIGAMIEKLDYNSSRPYRHGGKEL